MHINQFVNMHLFLFYWHFVCALETVEERVKKLLVTIFYPLLKLCVCIKKWEWKEIRKDSKLLVPSNVSLTSLFFLFCLSCLNRVNLLSALSQLILFLCLLTHNCLIYKRPFNIHSCLGDIRQTLRRRLEIYWLSVLLLVLVVWWATGGRRCKPVLAHTQDAFFQLLSIRFPVKAGSFFCRFTAIFPFGSNKYSTVLLIRSVLRHLL